MKTRGDGQEQPPKRDEKGGDEIEERLEAAREKLRQAHERLSTREHAIIDVASRDPSDEDDLPTQPNINPAKR